MILLKVDKVTELTIRSVGQYEAAETECENNIQRCWHDLVEAALQTIVAQDRCQLEELEIGDESQLALPIPMHILQALPRNPPAFSKLDMLALLNIDRRQIGKYAPISHTRTVMEDLTQLASLAPNMTDLKYTANGSRFLYDIIDYEIKEPPAQLPSLLPLTHIELSHVAFDEVHLKHVLLHFEETLTALILNDVNIVSGTWRAIFSVCRHILDLEYVDISKLLQNSSSVDFQAILKHTPVLIDEDIVRTRDLEFYEAMDDVVMPSIAYDSRVRELEEMTADGWIWVCHNRRHRHWFMVHEDDGDDVDMWLALVEDHYTVR